MRKLVAFVVLISISLCLSYARVNDEPEAPPGYTVFLLSCGIRITVPGDYTDTNGKLWCDLDKEYCKGGCPDN